MLAEDFLIRVCATYQQEYECHSALMHAPTPDPSSIIRVSVHYRTTTKLAYHFQRYLSKFEETCNKRCSLSRPQWITVFYSLCIMSIAHFILIDATSFLDMGDKRGFNN